MNMKVFAGVAAALLVSTSTAFAEVKVTMHDGRVSIVAKDATVRQILAEWARVGQTKIVNMERIPGGPMTIELAEVPEQQALDLLLRSVSGYMAAPRPVSVASLSQFDRIVVMPTSAAPRAMAAPASTPTFQQPQYMPQPQPTDDDVEEAPAPNVPMPNGGIQNPRGPVFNTFPQPQVVTPQMQQNGVTLGMPPVPQQTQPGAPQTVPQPFGGGGVAVPGMVVQPPPQPGQIPGQPVQPGQPIRRPQG